MGLALRFIQEHPADPWAVAGLAARPRCLRSAFARSFADLVGVPPMTYLKQWRLSLAADLPLGPDHTHDAVARRVGHSAGSP